MTDLVIFRSHIALFHTLDFFPTVVNDIWIQHHVDDELHFPSFKYSNHGQLIVLQDYFPILLTRERWKIIPLLAASGVNEDCFSQMFIFKIHIHLCFNLTYPNVDTCLDQILLHQLHCRHSTWVANINSFDPADDIILLIYSCNFNHIWT